VRTLSETNTTNCKRRNSDFEQSETEEWQESEMMILNVVKMKNFKKRICDFEERN